MKSFVKTDVKTRTAFFEVSAFAVFKMREGQGFIKEKAFERGCRRSKYVEESLFATGHWGRGRC